MDSSSMDIMDIMRQIPELVGNGLPFQSETFDDRADPIGLAYLGKKSLFVSFLSKYQMRYPSPVIRGRKHRKIPNN